MRVLSRSLAALTVLAAAVAAGPTTLSAQQTAGEPSAGALFRAGLEASRRGELDVAVDQLTRSIAVAPRAPAYFLLAQVQQRAGRPTEAVVAYKRFLKMPDAGRNPGRVQRARAALDSLRASHAWVRLHRWLRPLSITVDGQTPTHSVVVLPPGVHRFEIEQRDGQPRWGRDLELTPGRYLLDLHPHSPQAAPTLRLRRARSDGARAQSTSAAKSAAPACAHAPWCMGPWITLGLSHLGGIGFQARNGPFGLAVDLQASPSIGLGTLSVQTTLVSGSLRYHPAGYPFFAGVGIAYQYLSGGGTRRGERLQAEAEVTSLLVSAGFSGGDGWVVGADFGLMIDLHDPYVRLHLPADSSYFEDEDLDAALEQEIVERVRDDLLSLRNFFPVPFQINLIRVGYMF